MCRAHEAVGVRRTESRWWPTRLVNASEAAVLFVPPAHAKWLEPFERGDLHGTFRLLRQARERGLVGLICADTRWTGSPPTATNLRPSADIQRQPSAPNAGVPGTLNRAGRWRPPGRVTRQLPRRRHQGLRYVRPPRSESLVTHGPDPLARVSVRSSMSGPDYSARLEEPRKRR